MWPGSSFVFVLNYVCLFINLYICFLIPSTLKDLSNLKWKFSQIHCVQNYIFLYLWKTMETEKQASFSHKEKEPKFGEGFPLFSLQYFELLLPLGFGWSRYFCHSNSTPCSLPHLCCLLPGLPSPASHPPRSADGSFSDKAVLTSRCAGAVFFSVAFIFLAHLFIVY